jgi:rfaE bifunctional protein kinase chain/domain
MTQPETCNVKDFERVAAIRAKVKPGERIVFVSGKFNIIHPGHIRLFEFARQYGDFVVIGVVNQGIAGITMTREQRLSSVGSISLIDQACLIEGSLDSFLKELRPDVVVKGKEYSSRDNIEKDIVQSYGGKLVFSSGEMRFSSRELIRNEYMNFHARPSTISPDFMQRHSIKAADILSRIKSFSGLTVTVIGDMIIDDYIDCEALGMSQEDPTIVVTPVDRRRFVGGAGVVSAHARGLGARVKFVTVTGRDGVAEYAQTTLREKGIETHFVFDESRPTTLKSRYRASGKTLLRVSELRQHAVEQIISDKILQAVKSCLDESDLLVFSDFNYGCLPQQLVTAIIAYAKSRNILITADSQASSQLSDISRFQQMRLITPTEREARLALQDFETGLAALAEALRNKAEADNLIITLGGDGMLVLGEEQGEWMADQLPALNSNPKDTAGAGDSLLISASLALCSGMSIWQSCYLGAIAAAVQVSRVGNTPLTIQEIVSELEWHHL